MKGIYWRKYGKWIVITVIFLLIITVLDKNTVIEAVSIKRRINEMRREQRYYHEKAKEDSTFLQNMRQDWFIEKYARENFYMKNAGEEIYVVEE